MYALQLDDSFKLSLVVKENVKIKENEIRVRVASCGICGTDHHIIKRESRVKTPVVLGHEFGGVVQEVGKDVASVSIGDVVVIDPNIACHVCDYCRIGKYHLCEGLVAIGVDIDGGMSDTCIVPETQAYKVPSSFDRLELPFVEPLSCVLHGLDRLTARYGEKTLVIGAGTIGLMFVLLLKQVAGELCVDEPNRSRLEKAIDFGATAFDSRSREYFDSVIECSGTADGFEKAIRMVKRGGRILVFGVAPRSVSTFLSPNVVYSKEVTIFGSYVNPYTFPRAIGMILNKKLPLCDFEIQTYSLKNYEEAFAASESGRYSKVLFEFGKIDET
jgi:L-iditol 2-dehydrogenase